MPKMKQSIQEHRMVPRVLGEGAHPVYVTLKSSAAIAATFASSASCGWQNKVKQRRIGVHLLRSSPRIYQDVKVQYKVPVKTHTAPQRWLSACA